MANDCSNTLTIDGLSKEEVQTFSNLFTSETLLETLLPNAEFSDWGAKRDIYDCDIDDVQSDHIRCNFNSVWYPVVYGIINITKKFPNATFDLSYEEESNDFMGRLKTKNGGSITNECDITEEVEKLMEADIDLDEDDAMCTLRNKIEDEIDKKCGAR